MRQTVVTQASHVHYWQMPCASVGAKARFGVSYLNTTLRSTIPTTAVDMQENEGWNSFDLVAGSEGNGIYLSCLPHSDMLPILLQQHFPERELSQCRGLVVSCNDYFELAGSGAFKAIVSPSQWQANNVAQHHMLMTDFTAGISPELVIETLAVIKQYREQGLPVLIHCKAGRARSGMLMLLTMLQEDPETYCQYTADRKLDVAATYAAVHQALLAQRKQVTIGRDKAQVAMTVLEQQFDPESKQFYQPAYTVGTDPASYLQSSAFSAALIQATSYRTLMCYLAAEADPNSKRTVCVLEFIQRLVGGDVGCLQQLHNASESADRNRKDGLFAFVNAQPWTEKCANMFAPNSMDMNKSKRQTLCKELYATVEQLVKVHCPEYQAQVVVSQP